MKFIFIVLITLFIILFFTKPIIKYFKKIKELRSEKIIIETNDLRINSIIYKYIFLDFNGRYFTLCKFSKTEKNEILISFRYDFPKTYKNTFCLFRFKPKNEIHNFQITKYEIENEKLNIIIKNYLLTTYNLSIKIKDNSDYIKIKEIFDI